MKHSGLLKTCKVIRHISNRTKKIWVQNKGGKVRERKKNKLLYIRGVYNRKYSSMMPSISYISVYLFEPKEHSAFLRTKHQPRISLNNTITKKTLSVLLLLLFFTHSVCFPAWCVGMCMCPTQSTHCSDRHSKECPPAGSLAFRGTWQQSDKPHKAFRN